MDVVSLGYRTDLALLRLTGSQVRDRGDHLVVRSPHNPLHWWGNFLLLRDRPAPQDAQAWVDRFVAELPEARHFALGVDGTDGQVEDLAPFGAMGMHVETATVMTARSVRPPPRPNTEATYRALSGGEDWRQWVGLRVACNDTEPDGDFREFTTRKGEGYRELVAAGHGHWFGAFERGRLLSSMGLFRAGDGLARFQSVETHPDARGRGLAGTLVHHVSRFGLGEMGADTLVMVADPEYAAIRIYRSVGFTDTESQLQVERAPCAADESALAQA